MTDFQPHFPAEVPLSDAELAFIDESPPGLFPENQNSNFGYVIRKIFSDRIQDLINQIDTIYSEKFVLTSSQYLNEWEETVGLPVNTGLFTTAQRRNLIINRLRKGPFTRAMRRAIVESFITATFGTSPGFDLSGIPIDSSGIPLYSGVNSIIGTYRIYENIQNFSYEVWIKNGLSPDFLGLTRELNRITPAGISFLIDSSQSDVLRYGRIVLNSQPVHYWRMQGLTDQGIYGGSGSPLTANGGVTAGSLATPGLLHANVVTGAEGAATFDGVNDYFSATPHASIVAPPQITFEGWIRVTNFPTASNHRMVASQSSRFLSMFAIDAVTRSWSFSLNIDGVQQYCNPVRPLATGTVYHVVGTFDGVTMKVYENGVLVGTLVPGGRGVIGIDGTPILVGAYTGPGHFMNGVIDEVGVYNRALPVAEILDHYNTGRDVATY